MKGQRTQALTFALIARDPDLRALARTIGAGAAGALGVLCLLGYLGVL